MRNFFSYLYHAVSLQSTFTAFIKLVFGSSNVIYWFEFTTSFQTNSFVKH